MVQAQRPAQDPAGSRRGQGRIAPPEAWEDFSNALPGSGTHDPRVGVLNELTCDELRAMLRRFGRKPSGVKADIVARLLHECSGKLPRERFGVVRAVARWARGRPCAAALITDEGAVTWMREELLKR